MCPERAAAVARALRAAAVARPLLAAMALVAGAPWPAVADEEPAEAAPAPARPTLSRPPYTSVVRAAPPRASPGSTTVAAEEARRLPGTADDPLEVVEALPGVARPALGSGQIVLWGANPADTRVLVDGVDVPRLYHGGLRGVIDADLVRGIEVSPGGFGAEYGRALGGQVLVSTRRLTEDGVHGHVGADLLDASAGVRAALGSRLHLAAAGRFGYLDRLAAALAPQAGTLFAIPGYDDYQAKATLSLGVGEELSAVLLGAADRLRRTQASVDPAGVRSDAADSTFHRVYLRYQALRADGDAVTVTPFFGIDDTHSNLAYGATPARLDEHALVYGLRAGYRTTAARWAALFVGADVLGRRSRFARAGSLGVPAREGDPYVFGRPPGSDVNTDIWSTHLVDLAAHASVELTLGPVTLTPGVRLDGLVIDGSRQSPRVGETPSVGFTRVSFTIDPRLSLRVRAGGRVNLFAAGGLYHQAPEGADLSAVFGNPSLGPLRAAHAAAGATIAATGSLSVEVVGFYRRLDDQVSRSALPSPALAAALTQDGTGWSYGGQVMIRQEPWRGLSGWIAYTVGRSERRDHPGEPARPSSYDQTHALTLVASYGYRGWGFGLRLRYATGAPRTPVTGAFLDTRDDAWQPVFGRVNGSRLPDFVALDLRLDRRFDLGPVTLRLYLDVQNVTNRDNAEEVVYSQAYDRRDYLRGLPTLGVLGARLEF